MKGVNKKMNLKFLLWPLVALLLSSCASVVNSVAGSVASNQFLAKNQEDRRAVSVAKEDLELQQKITATLRQKLGPDPYLEVVVYNRRLLVLGRVNKEAYKEAVEPAVAGYQLRHVHNELTISPEFPTLSDRVGYESLQKQVDFRLWRDDRINSRHVLVKSVDNQVYLLGLMYREEGIAATDVASKTEGVKKVISLFDYLD